MQYYSESDDMFFLAEIAAREEATKQYNRGYSEGFHDGKKSNINIVIVKDIFRNIENLRFYHEIDEKLLRDIELIKTIFEEKASKALEGSQTRMKAKEIYFVDQVGKIAPIWSLSPVDSVGIIFTEIDKILDETYNRHIFGPEDLEDEEKEAVMNFHNDMWSRVEELKKRYLEES